MKPTLNFFTVLLLVVLSLSVNASLANVRLPQLIGDGMVLQRDAPINIWGWADAGENISVKFNGKHYSTKTSVGGQWSVMLPTMKAGGPYEMDIDGNNHVVVHDILIGDVWFCSGQSNMVFQMERDKETYPEEIANAHYPEIRNFFVPTVSDIARVHDDLPPRHWVGADPISVLNFGAAAYFFAKQLYNKYHVPIGLINSSVGGTPIQAWISEQGLKDVPQYTDRLRVIRDTAYTNRLHALAVAYGEQLKRRDALQDAGLTGPLKWYDTAYLAQNWHRFWLPGYWADQGVRGLTGVIWFRKEITIPASMAGKPAKLFMGRIVDADETYINGVLVGKTTYQYPPRRYTVPAGVLKAGRNIVIVRVTNTSLKGGFVLDKPYDITDGAQKIDLRGDWEYKAGEVYPPIKGDPGGFYAQNEPTGLYNTMVAPAINYAIKGILWYQGEANASKPGDYGQLLQALIADWRSKWKKADLPFIYAQLPNFMEADYLPEGSKWAELREEQLKTLSVPNTAMAVIIDAGEWNDIHPLDKKDVGERLALGAEKIAYHEDRLVSFGPIYQTSKIDGNKIEIAFISVGSGLEAKGGELTQFAIAGIDKQYVWAKATIKGDKVIVWSDDIAKPMYVRYAWADNPDGANLYNKEGLPASPFTTDVP